GEPFPPSAPRRVQERSVQKAACTYPSGMAPFVLLTPPSSPPPDCLYPLERINAAPLFAPGGFTDGLATTWRANVSKCVFCAAERKEWLAYQMVTQRMRDDEPSAHLTG
ncbi:unnamed protein product, partial [Ixodes persulcatus]